MKKFLILILMTTVISTFYLKSEIMWEKTNGPLGGHISQLAKDNEGNIYALTLSSLYKGSFNKVKIIEWTKFPVADFNIGSLDFDKNGNAFATTSYDPNSKQKIYVSSDNLVTWQIADLEPEPTGVYKLVIRENGDVMALTELGIFRSTDAGASWQKVYNQLTSTSITCLSYISDGTIFASDYQGLYISSDEGTSWSEVMDDEGILNALFVGMTIDEKDNIYVNLGSGIFKSNDKGKTWKHLLNGLSANSFNLLKVIGPGLIIAANSIDTYYSTDEGEKWEKISKISSTDMAIINVSKYLVGTQSGVQYAEMLTGPWSAKNYGITETAVTAMITIKTSNETENIIAGNERGEINISSNNGDSWENVYKTTGATVTSMISDKEGYLYCSSMWGGIDKSSDSGLTWVNKSTGITDPDIGTIIADNNGNLYGGTFSKLFKSTNKGDSWSVCYSPSQSLQAASSAVNSSNVLFFGTWSAGAIKSTDAGATWTPVNSGVSAKIVIVKTDINDKLFGITENGVLYLSENDGQTWTMVNNQKYFNNIFPVSDNYYLALVLINQTTLKMYSSTDKGLTWAEESNGLNDARISSLYVKPDGYALSGTNEGVFKTVGTVSVLDNLTETGNDLLIYPNPSSNFISVDLKDTQNSNPVKIITLDGKEVKNFNTIDGKNIKIDISELSSGTYFIQIGKLKSKFVKN